MEGASVEKPRKLSEPSDDPHGVAADLTTILSADFDVQGFLDTTMAREPIRKSDEYYVKEFYATRFPGLLLRVDRKAVPRDMKTPTSNQKVLRIVYDGKIAKLPQDQNFHIPLLAIMDKEHRFSKQESLQPHQVFMDVDRPRAHWPSRPHPIPYVLVPKEAGHPLNSELQNGLRDLRADNEADQADAAIRRGDTQTHRKLWDKISAMHALWNEIFEKHRSIADVTADQAIKYAGRRDHGFENCVVSQQDRDEFLRRYNNLIQAFKATIEEHANLPPSAFDQALKLLSKYEGDWDWPENKRVFVRFDHLGCFYNRDRKEFEFSDIVIGEHGTSPHYRPVEWGRFISALMGGELLYSDELRTHTMRKEDITHVRTNLQKILDKVSAALQRAVRNKEMYRMPGDPLLRDYELRPIRDVVQHFGLSLDAFRAPPVHAHADSIPHGVK